MPILKGGVGSQIEIVVVSPPIRRIEIKGPHGSVADLAPIDEVAAARIRLRFIHRDPP